MAAHLAVPALLAAVWVMNCRWPLVLAAAPAALPWLAQMCVHAGAVVPREASFASFASLACLHDTTGSIRGSDLA